MRQEQHSIIFFVRTQGLCR